MVISIYFRYIILFIIYYLLIYCMLFIYALSHRCHLSDAAIVVINY